MKDFVEGFGEIKQDVIYLCWKWNIELFFHYVLAICLLLAATVTSAENIMTNRWLVHGRDLCQRG